MGFWDGYSQASDAAGNQLRTQLLQQQNATQQAGAGGAWNALGGAIPGYTPPPQGGGLGSMLSGVGQRLGSLVGGAQPAGGGGGGTGSSPPPQGQGGPMQLPSAAPQPAGTQASSVAPQQSPQQQPQGGQQSGQKLDLPTILQRIKADPSLDTPQKKYAALQAAQPIMNDQATQAYHQLMLQATQQRIGDTEQKNATQAYQGQERIDATAGKNATSADQGQQRIDQGAQRIQQTNRRLDDLESGQKDKREQFEKSQQQKMEQYKATNDRKMQGQLAREIEAEQKSYYEGLRATLSAKKGGMPPDQLKDLQAEIAKQRQSMSDQLDQTKKDARTGTTAPSSGNSVPSSSTQKQPMTDDVKQQYQNFVRKYPSLVEVGKQRLTERGFDTSGL